MRQHRRAVLPTLILFAACMPALAQDRAVYDIVCEFTEVFIGGEENPDGPIKPGDWMVLQAQAPGPQDLPTNSGLIPGGTAVYWDLERQNQCGWAPPNTETTIGTATQSRAIVENGDQDAVGWDSIGMFFNFDTTEVTRCGMGLRDADGTTFETVNFPEELSLEGWQTNTCFMEGFTDGLLVTALGPGELIVEREEESSAIRIEVPYGDEKALIAAVIWANTFENDPSVGDIDIIFTGAKEDFVFDEPFANTGNALPVLTAEIHLLDMATFRRSASTTELFRFLQISGDGELETGALIEIHDFASAEGGGALLLTDNARLSLRGGSSFTGNFAVGDGGFALVEGNARLSLGGGSISECQSESNGGAVAVTGMGRASMSGISISNCSADGRGGAIYRGGSASIFLGLGLTGGSGTRSRLIGNSAGLGGGAIAVQGQSVDFGNSPAVQVAQTIFQMNSTEGSGCDIDLEIQGGPVAEADMAILNSNFSSPCPSATVNNQAGRLILFKNTFIDDGGEEVVITSPGATQALSNLFGMDIPDNVPQAGGRGGNTVKSSCSDDAAGLESLGYNISWDASCAFDQPSDRVSTDPLLSMPDENGVRSPLAGSPAIDHGLLEVSDVLGDGVLRLPCGIRDINGLGAPQDGDGDGTFECDAGAVEVQGEGAIEPGHSGAFFNALRDGEGQYVEILAGGQRAVVYTFSYKPDGTGAAWFIAVADVVGNSLVGVDLLRPIGTSWGDGFVAGDIEFTPAGGMSMVFPGCATGDPAGNVAYSGSRDLGFEPLITKAQRLSDIFGCAGDGVTPHPNASRSGSYYDPERNGEGLIIEWLPDGRVLVVMFTFAPDGEQMWMIGVAEAEGDSVTVDALYPTGFTRWGSGFDAGDVVLESWGTMTLTWAGEDSVTFEYNATAPAYGSATRNYVRLTNLASESP